MKRIETVAYYLGQFHPTAENDRFWGQGFTEWHNVARARPLFPGHVQPRLPGRLGFYDLRCDETLLAQQQLARESGVRCFCHWHYWMGGHRMLHRPLDQMLGLPDQGVQFMLGWANESWTGAWHGLSNQVIVEQTYGREDLAQHAKLIARYMSNGRYLETSRGKPFLIYKPRKIPNTKSYLGELKERVRDQTGVEVYLIGTWGPGRTERFSSPEELGLDAAVINNVGRYFRDERRQTAYAGMWTLGRKLRLGPEIRPYTDTTHTLLRGAEEVSGIAHATVVTGWDNTPRSGRRGLVLKGYSRMAFAEAVRRAAEFELRNEPPILFLKSWNEWAEGNVMEPAFNEEWSPAAVFKEGIVRAQQSAG